jgi:hypothetical protein
VVNSGKVRPETITWQSYPNLGARASGGKASTRGRARRGRNPL